MTTPEQKREITELTIRNLMRTENGRDFIWQLLEDCGTFATVWHKDHDTRCFESGKREIGLQLVSELKRAAPDEYIMMMKEKINE